MSGNIGRLFVGKASSAKYVCCCVLNGNVLCTRMLLKNYCSEIRSCSVKNLYRRTLLNCAKFMEFCHHANGRVKIAAVAPGAEVLWYLAMFLNFAKSNFEFPIWMPTKRTQTVFKVASENVRHRSLIHSQLIREHWNMPLHEHTNFHSNFATGHLQIERNRNVLDRAVLRARTKSGALREEFGLCRANWSQLVSSWNDFSRIHLSETLGLWSRSLFLLWTYPSSDEFLVVLCKLNCECAGDLDLRMFSQCRLGQ